jgi:hypothetical protein
MFLTPIEYCQPIFSKYSKTLEFQNPESALSSRSPRAPARSTLAALAEAQHPLLRVRRPLAHPDVQHLARVRARREDRVVAQQLGVPVGRAALQAAADLADEAVDIDDEPAITGTRARLPRPLNRLAEQRVELADMPERKRPQERPQRRRCRDPAAQQPARAARAQHAAVIDAVGAQHHRVEQRHHLAARVGATRPIATQPHAVLRERLDTEAPGERRDEHHPGIGHRAFVVELDLHAVRSDRLVILHHEGDLPLQAPAAVNSRKSPAQEVILLSGPDGTRLPHRCRVGGRRLAPRGIADWCWSPPAAASNRA